MKAGNIQEVKLTDRQEEAKTGKQREVDIHAEEQTDRHAGRQTDKQAGRQQTDKQRERHTDRQSEVKTTGNGTNNQTYRQIDIQKDYNRQTMRQLIMAQKVCSYGAHRVWNKKTPHFLMDKLHTSVEE